MSADKTGEWFRYWRTSTVTRHPTGSTLLCDDCSPPCQKRTSRVWRRWSSPSPLRPDGFQFAAEAGKKYQANQRLGFYRSTWRGEPPGSISLSTTFSARSVALRGFRWEGCHPWACASPIFRSSTIHSRRTPTTDQKKAGSPPEDTCADRDRLRHRSPLVTVYGLPGRVKQVDHHPPVVRRRPGIQRSAERPRMRPRKQSWLQGKTTLGVRTETRVSNSAHGHDAGSGSDEIARQVLENASTRSSPATSSDIIPVLTSSWPR